MIEILSWIWKDKREHDFRYDWKCISKMYAPEGYHQRETVIEWRQKPLGTRNKKEKETEWEKQKKLDNWQMV